MISERSSDPIRECSTKDASIALAKLAGKIDDVHYRKPRRPGLGARKGGSNAIRQLDQPVAASASPIKGNNRRSSAAQHEDSSGKGRQTSRDVACVVARGWIQLLVGPLVLLIDHDQTRPA